MAVQADRRIVIVTRATQLESLRRKFATRSQAKFQIVSAKKRELARTGVSLAQMDQVAEAAFAEVDAAAQAYVETVHSVQEELEAGHFDLPMQVIDREFVPSFVFGPHDIIVTIGQDGLVANTAKYVLGRPIVAVNPDPARIDGVLLPFHAAQVRMAVKNVLAGRARLREVTLAQATLADGQKLLAFNELFIGCRTHASARYKLTLAKHAEIQSSSGVLVSTGAGSTGWLSSVFNMANGVMSAFRGDAKRAPSVAPKRLAWEDSQLVFVVREPFISKTSRAEITAGLLASDSRMVIESEMASDGVIFSDGVEADYLEFNSGAIAQIGCAPGRAIIVTHSE